MSEPKARTCWTVEPRDRVLVNGAGGGAGAFAVQIAKTAGVEVTGVDNGWKQQFMRSLGVDHVRDYTATDYTKTGARYDLILNLVCERPMFAIRRAVAAGGRYSVVGGSVGALLSAATVGRLLSTGGRSMLVSWMTCPYPWLSSSQKAWAACSIEKPADRCCLVA